MSHCLVRDLESANGTFLAGRRISGAPLADGDRIRFGDIEFTLDNPGTKIAAEEAPPRWRSRGIQASAVAAAIGAVILVGVLRHQGGDEQMRSSAPAESLLAGQNNFDLPEASRGFVGNWYGLMPVTLGQSFQFRQFFG